MLIDQYTPVNYRDTFSLHISSNEKPDAQQILDKLFTSSSPVILCLLRIRDLLVKPLGIETGKLKSTPLIIAADDHEAIISKDDKHLLFYVSVFIENKKENQYEVRVTTSVVYHNWLGRIYFFFIRPFHKRIVPMQMKHTFRKEQII